jgi:hypothetical protein
MEIWEISIGRSSIEEQIEPEHVALIGCAESRAVGEDRNEG